MFFHTAWVTMINFYHSTLTDLFPLFVRTNMNFSALKWSTSRLLVKLHLLWTSCQGAQMNVRLENLNTYFTWLNRIKLNKILVAVENFKKCTVALPGGTCSQLVASNTSRLNQPQSDIIRFVFSDNALFFLIDRLWSHVALHDWRARLLCRLRSFRDTSYAHSSRPYRCTYKETEQVNSWKNKLQQKSSDR